MKLPKELEIQDFEDKNILKEDDGGGGGGDYGGFGYGMGGMYGVQFGSAADLYNIFVKPFTDVIGIAAGKTKELGVTAQVLAKVVFESIATSLIPALEDDFDKIFEKGNEDINKIKQEYQEVYKTTMDTLLDHDILFAAFFYSPAPFIAAWVGKKAPLTLLGSLNTISGGLLDKQYAKVKTSLAKYNVNLKSDGGGMSSTYGPGSSGGIGMGMDGGGMGENTIISKKDLLIEAKLKDIYKFFANKTLASQQTRQIQAKTRKAINSMLKNVVLEYKTIQNANNVQQIEKLINKNISDIDKLNKLPPEEKVKTEKLILDTVKKSAKTLYKTKLQNFIKAAKDAGTPDDAEFIVAIRKAISLLG